MVQDRKNNVENPTDQDYVKQKLKAIKRQKQAGNEEEAQRLADELFIWLGWE
jgi:hypothetical protein